MAERVLMGRIGRPHGVRGLVCLVSYADPPAAIFGYGALVTEAGAVLRLSRAGRGEELLARIEGIADRDAAARLTNAALYVERASLGPVASDEFFHADLLGLAAEDPVGRALGRVAEIHDYGAGVSLEIAGGPAPLLVPFTRAAVPVVDLAARRIVVDPPVELVAEPRPEPRPEPNAEPAP